MPVVSSSHFMSDSVSPLRYFFFTARKVGLTTSVYFHDFPAWSKISPFYDGYALLDVFAFLCFFRMANAYGTPLIKFRPVRIGRPLIGKLVQAFIGIPAEVRTFLSLQQCRGYKKDKYRESSHRVLLRKI